MSTPTRTPHTITFPAQGDVPETTASCRCPIGADHVDGAAPEPPAKPELVHFLRWEHDGATVRARFTCMGDRTDPCHRYPLSDGARWTANDECVGVSWFENATAEEMYDGDDGARARSGPIVLSQMNDGGLTWDYATDTPDLDTIERLAGQHLTARVLGNHLPDGASDALARAVPGLVAIIRTLAGVA